MINNLDSSISTISEDDMNAFFEDSDSNPTADTLIGGKEAVKSVKEDEVVRLPGKTTDGGIEIIEDLDALLDEPSAKKKKEVETKEEVTDEDVEGAEPTVPKKNKVKEEKAEDTEEVNTPEVEAINEVLKNTVNYLVEKGAWLDFEGREDLDIDQATYAELVAKQDEARLSGMFNELVDSTGDYGKAIIGFIKQGGNPEEVIDIFKEQKQIENFDTSDELGKKALVSKYYKDVLNWKNDKIERHLTSLISNDDLDTEVTDIKDLYDDFHKAELTKVTQEQQAYQEEQKRREDSFKQNIVTAISDRKDISDKDKKLIEKSVLQYTNKLPNGTAVSDFYVKFANVQKDPKEYIDLVMFVMDKENYLKTIKTEVKNKKVDEAFNFVKGNTALSTKKGSNYDSVKREEKITTFDFGLKRK